MMALASKCVCGCRRNEHGDRAEGYTCGTCRCERYRPKPMKRKTPLKRSTKPIPARKKDPKKRRFASRRTAGYSTWVLEASPYYCYVGHASTVVGVGRRHGTAMAECEGPAEPMHLKTRGSGGGDVGNVVKGCAYHHTRQHAMGIWTFQKVYGIDLKAEAEYMGSRYESTTKGVTPHE